MDVGGFNEGAGEGEKRRHHPAAATAQADAAQSCVKFYVHKPEGGRNRGEIGSENGTNILFLTIIGILIPVQPNESAGFGWPR